MQKGKGAGKSKTAGSELVEALPGHQGQQKSLQPRLGGGGASEVRPQHSWDALSSVTEMRIKHLVWAAPGSKLQYPVGNVPGEGR